MLAMGHVEAKRIDARFDQARDGTGVVRGGPERRYDFRAPQREQLDFGIDGHGQ